MKCPAKVGEIRPMEYQSILKWPEEKVDHCWLLAEQRRCAKFLGILGNSMVRAIRTTTTTTAAATTTTATKTNQHNKMEFDEKKKNRRGQIKKRASGNREEQDKDCYANANVSALWFEP